MAGSAFAVQVYSGQSGMAGISGSSGTSGMQGSSGDSGTSGIQGFSGNSGTSGMQGSSGNSGTSGMQGSSGFSGTLPDPIAHVKIQDIGEVVVNKGNVSGATTVDIYYGNVATATATGAVQWTFANPFENGRACTLSLILTNGGVGTQTWPSGTKWMGGAPPDLTVSGIDLLIFNTTNAGTTWLAVVGGLNFT
jgi:hypothetical protein